MNALATANMTGPHGKVSECIQFTINNTSESFILHNIMTVGQQYTFSLWLMTDSDATLSVGGSTFSSNNTWNKYFVTFVSDTANLSLNFNTTGVYYIYHPQLEIGNQVTDWTPAPEDQADIMETRFTIENDRIEAEFTVVNESINDLGELIKNQYSKKITEDENGLTITDSEGVYSVQVDNVEGVTIRKNGEIRSQLVDDNFYTGNIVVEVNERAQFGGFAFVPRSDGSLSFLKVGE